MQCIRPSLRKICEGVPLPRALALASRPPVCHGPLTAKQVTWSSITGPICSAPRRAGGLHYKQPFPGPNGPHRAASLLTFKYSNEQRIERSPDEKELKETRKRERGGGGGGHGFPNPLAARAPGALQEQWHPREHIQRGHGGSASVPPLGEHILSVPFLLAVN